MRRVPPRSATKEQRLGRTQDLSLQLHANLMSANTTASLDTYRRPDRQRSRTHLDIADFEGTDQRFAAGFLGLGAAVEAEAGGPTGDEGIA
jgi:hypothetical protein